MNIYLVIVGIVIITLVSISIHLYYLFTPPVNNPSEIVSIDSDCNIDYFTTFDYRDIELKRGEDLTMNGYIISHDNRTFTVDIAIESMNKTKVIDITRIFDNPIVIKEFPDGLNVYTNTDKLVINDIPTDDISLRGKFQLIIDSSKEVKPGHYIIEARIEVNLAEFCNLSDGYYSIESVPIHIKIRD
jgi:hypothetical protein